MAENLTTTIAGKKPKKNLAYQRDKDREMVKGVFNYHEVPGGTLGFFYKKYKGDQPERYRLKDGEIVSIPLGVAKHLNSNGKYPIHAHAVSVDGKNVYKIGEMKRRFGFQSLEFIDPEDYSKVDPSLFTAEPV
jgi:hypothetical protein